METVFDHNITGIFYASRNDRKNAIEYQTIGKCMLSSLVQNF